jgi:hypothetical protein
MPFIETYKIEFFSRPSQGHPFGVITMRFEGGGSDQVKLTPTDFTAACAVLSQKRIFFDGQQDTFVAVDDNEDLQSVNNRVARR